MTKRIDRNLKGLALDAGACNGDFARLVHEAVDEIRAHAEHCPSRRFDFGQRGGCSRRRGRRGSRQRRRRDDDGQRCGYGRCKGRLRRCHRLEPRQRRVHFALLQAIEHEG